MANYFKTRFVPNPDGTDSTTALNNSNTAFVHTYFGDDLTGDGTREFPYRSAYKANQKSGVSNIVFRGVINEAINSAKILYGDDINQVVLTSNYTVFIQMNNCTIDKPIIYSYSELKRVIILNSVQLNYTSDMYYNFCLFKNLHSYGAYDFYSGFKHSTIYGINASGYGNPRMAVNSIFVKVFDPKNNVNGLFYGMNYCLFPSDCVFKYYGAQITSPTWTNNSKTNIQLLRDAYISAGMSILNADSLFMKDSFDNETCRIIKEVRNGGTSANIFNKYDGSGNVLDYSLNPDSTNEALYASDTGGYVGCFKPSIAITADMLDAPINVNVDGSDDTGVAGTLLNKNSDGSIDFNNASDQTWNRIKMNVTAYITNGIKLNGGGTMSTDGTPFGYIIGKFQNLMNPTALTPADILEANTIYKICNPIRTIYQAAIYNGNQYLPDYFFKTGTTPLAFTLLNSDSGTVVKKVLASPLEGKDIIPYDNMDDVSATFPRFTMPMMGNCLMLFHKIGTNIDKPVLFSEVTNDKIAYYDDWAVTNADQEFVTLAADTTNYYYKIPVLKYFRVEFNGHFNADYDQ